MTEKRKTFKQILDDVWAMKEEDDWRKRSSTASPVEHNVHEISWKDGDRFNYRIFAALLLTNPASAKLYFRTTH